MSLPTGELAALGTSLVWSATFVFFSIAARRIGPQALNRLRLAVAIGILLLLHTLAYGTPIPLDVGAERLGWLALAGVIGFVLSDALLFRSLVLLGPQRSSLVMVLVPVVSAFLAWGAFGEIPSAVEAVAGLAVVGGIALVLWPRKGEEEPASTRLRGKGVLLAAAAACCQASRYLLSKAGMEGGFPALSTNVLQIGVATLAIWGLTVVTGKVRPTLSALRDRTGRRTMAAGALLGPVTGVTLSLVALASAPVGVASTLMALSPVILLVVSRVAFKERIRPRAVAGTLLAVAGVAALFLV